jgi:glutaryl-CoA dehydrogenase (non-decarboxylating)
MTMQAPVVTPDDLRASFREFVDTQVAPFAGLADRDQLLPTQVIRSLAEAGYLGSTLSREHGGRALDALTYGQLSEEFGRTCQSVRNFVAVVDMVAYAIARWGTPAQAAAWLGRITSGETIAAFALTEPDIGSDAKNVTTTARRDAADAVLTGRKKWISFGQIADLFLVFAQYDGAHTGFLVERNTPGLTITPIEGLLGLRGSMLAELDFDQCRVPLTNMVGLPGMGLLFVASSALEMGRYSTAWGCVGLAQACLDASTSYAADRVQYGTPIADHQLVRRMLADMVTGIAAARSLCRQAGSARTAGDPDAVNQTLIAKYFASTMVNRVADDAVQIHGAQGIGAEFAVQRHLRDARVMEIIEGTTQIHQDIIGRLGRGLG